MDAASEPWVRGTSFRAILAVFMIKVSSVWDTRIVHGSPFSIGYSKWCIFFLSTKGSDSGLAMLVYFYNYSFTFSKSVSRQNLVTFIVYSILLLRLHSSFAWSYLAGTYIYICAWDPRSFVAPLSGPFMIRYVKTLRREIETAVNLHNNIYNNTRIIHQYMLGAKYFCIYYWAY